MKYDPTVENEFNVGSWQMIIFSILLTKDYGILEFMIRLPLCNIT